MNTYTDTLQQSITGILTDLNDQQTELQSVQTAAQYTLYYAQGAERTARTKLQRTNVQVVNTCTINDQAVINNNQVWNLVASATDAKTNVSASGTNMATAAANVQIASNAVALLASDLGAALSIASATLYGTDTYTKIASANTYINEVANQARRASLKAMEASSYIAEVSAGDVLTQAQSAQAKIVSLQKATLADFNQYSALQNTENQTVSQTSQTEKQAEGSLRKAAKEYSAITMVYDNANTQLNLDLDVRVFNSQQIQVQFNRLPSPLPPFATNEAATIQLDAPPAVPSYFLTLVAESQVAMVNNDIANQMFAQLGDQGTSFWPVRIDESTIRQTAAMQPVMDMYGNALGPGSQYVVYVYAELTTAYKRYLNNFSDFLSAPSQGFVMATPLPMAFPSPQQAAQDNTGMLQEITPPAAAPGYTAPTTAQVMAMGSATVAAMSPDQIAALTAWQVAALTTEELAALNSAQIAALTPSQVAILANTQLNALVDAEISELSSAQIAALKPWQVAGLTTSQVTQLSSAQLTVLSATQLAALTPRQAAALLTSQLAVMASTQIAALLSGAVGALTTTQVSTLASSQLVAFTTAQVAALNSPQVQSLSSAQIAMLSSTQVGAWLPASVTALSSSQLAVISSAQLPALLPSLSTVQIARLTSAQLNTLSSSAIAALDSVQVCALNSTQISSLSTAQISALNTNALSALTTAQIQALKSEQIASLTTTQIVALNTTQMTAFTPRQLAAFTSAQDLALALPAGTLAGAVNELAEAVSSASTAYTQALNSHIAANELAKKCATQAKIASDNAAANQAQLDAATAELKKIGQEIANVNMTLNGYTQQQSTAQKALAEATANYNKALQDAGSKPDQSQKNALKHATEQKEAATQAVNFLNDQITVAQQAIGNLTISLNDANNTFNTSSQAAIGLNQAAAEDEAGLLAANSQAANAKQSVQTSYAVWQAALQAKNTADSYVQAENQVIRFYANLTAVGSNLTEFRCILVEMLSDSKPPAPPAPPEPHGYLTAEETVDPKPPIFFNLAIAEHVSAANYEVAAFESSHSDGSDGTPIVNCYTVTIEPSTTDNFGNLLTPNTKYQPYILSVVNEETDGSELALYTPVLSWKLPMWSFSASAAN